MCCFMSADRRYPQPFSDSSVEVIEISDDETPTANDSDKQIKGKPVLKHHLKANRKVGLIIPDFTRSKAGCDDQAAPSPLPSLLMLKRHSSAASSSSRDLDVDLQLLAKRRKLHELVASHCPSLSAPATSPAALPGTETSFTCPRPSSLTSLPPSLNARVSSYASVCVPRSFPTLSAMSKYYGFVRRDFLLEQYGCSDRQFLSKISVKRNIPLTANRDRYVLFPMWANKPSLPTVPGQPGTLTTGRCDMLMYSPLSIFVRAPDKPLWIYLGNYELRKSKKPLSAHEFKALPYECRMKWAKDILTPQRSQCYTTMRARVWLRKQGRQVTADALEEAMEDLKKTADKIGLVEADVLNALDAGEEELNVHLCIPVSYNADFSQDMSKHFAIKQMAALSLKKATPISGEATGSSTIPVRRSMRTRRHGPPFKTDPTAADVDAGEGEQDDANDSESS
ncbi:hypothetical protein BV25DRAFT_711197 [Artomyces pyxidatus]|uniref:Uncharacterized protein n=1 Tax=Artomyces pyxidatus TaxID=48021 RepID=A0ACB8T171_9AGAM|nr:hypothetical protein BV25DRAFT_711197 [Artomyces pyxidatus]